MNVVKEDDWKLVGGCVGQHAPEVGAANGEHEAMGVEQSLSAAHCQVGKKLLKREQALTWFAMTAAMLRFTNLYHHIFIS